MATTIYVIAGIVTIGFGIVALIKWVYNKYFGLSQEEKLQRRLELRDEFNQNLPEENEYNYRTDAIIIDIARMDLYPDRDLGGRGISPFFKVAIKGLYPNGFEVFMLDKKYATYDRENRQWNFAPDDYEGEDRVLACLIGKIPFDNTVRVNWEGDEFEQLPLIYCKFPGGEPYEGFLYYGDAYNINRLSPLDGLYVEPTWKDRLLLKLRILRRG